MTTARDELLQMHEDTCNAAREMMKAKNNDYAFGGDPFANFRGSVFIGIEPELGILMRSMDKFKRIETFVRSGNLAVKAESVEDAIEDVINYMILLKGIILEKKKNYIPNKEVCFWCNSEIIDKDGDRVCNEFNLAMHIQCYNEWCNSDWPKYHAGRKEANV